jgi:Uma2 family endonuclease
VEVAVSSLAVDRGAKAHLHAQSGVPEYWVVDVEGRVVEVHTEPRAGRYDRFTPFRPGEEITVGTLEGVRVPVASFLR